MGVAPGRRASGPGLRWHGSTKAWRSPPTLQAHPSASSPHPVRHRLGSPSTRRLAPHQTRDSRLRDVKARLLPPAIARQQDVPDVARCFQPVPVRGRIPDRPWSAKALLMAGSGSNLARLRAPSTGSGQARCPGHGGTGPHRTSHSPQLVRRSALATSDRRRRLTLHPAGPPDQRRSLTPEPSFFGAASGPNQSGGAHWARPHAQVRQEFRAVRVGAAAP